MPEPEEPMIANARPSSREKLMSHSTLTPPKLLLMSSTSSMVIFTSLCFKIIQTLFQPVEQQRQYAHKDQKEKPCRKQRPDQTL